MPPAQLLAAWLGVKAFPSLHLSFPKWHVKITTPGSQKDDVMGLLETPTHHLGPDTEEQESRTSSSGAQKP